jgi:DeoR/GlpR family transcriptional regulator of sugar metabolism
LCAAAAETIVLASPEKLATAAPFQVVGLHDIDGIVALRDTAEPLLAPYRDRGITIHTA